MTELNAAASEAMLEGGADAATDVTGFGLAGHLRQMVDASGVSATVDVSAIELLPGVLELARDRVVPGGTRRNHEFVSPFVSWGDLDRAGQLVVADAQTSGGLLIASTAPDAMEAAFAGRGLHLQRIGETDDGPPGRIRFAGRLSA
jgi:selenide,water dikinase